MYANDDIRDFQFQKTKGKKLILNYDHRAMFIPKFHCELNQKNVYDVVANNTLKVIVITRSLNN